MKKYFKVVAEYTEFDTKNVELRDIKSTTKEFAFSSGKLNSIIIINRYNLKEMNVIIIISAINPEKITLSAFFFQLQSVHLIKGL